MLKEREDATLVKKKAGEEFFILKLVAEPSVTAIVLKQLAVMISKDHGSLSLQFLNIRL